MKKRGILFEIVIVFILLAMLLLITFIFLNTYNESIAHITWTIGGNSSNVTVGVK